MPTRRLPHTKPSRHKAMKAIRDRRDAVPPPTVVPLTPATLTKFDLLYPDFLALVAAGDNGLAEQMQLTPQLVVAQRIAMLHVSHMTQALNNAILRGKFDASVRAFYGLTGSAVPPMDSEADVLYWGDKVTVGETNRVAAGGLPITFPSLAEVQAAVNSFKTLGMQQAAAKEAYDNAQEKLEALNPELDKLILKLWNETETFFDEGDKPSLRRKAREWGVVYVPSAGEAPSPDEYSLIGKTHLLDGMPLADVKIVVVELGIESTADAAGLFYFGVLTPGSYTVVASIDGYLDTVLNGIIITAGAITELDIIMKPTPPAPEPVEP